MIQLSDTKIHSIRQQLSRQVAFPEELSNTFDVNMANDFLFDVAECKNEEELQSFAALLPRRRLNDLFGALLVVTGAESEVLVLRLLTILKQRLTASLAEIGWAFFQHHFPNDHLNRALASIISEMSGKSNELTYLSTVASVADLPIIDDTLPARLAMSLLQKQNCNLSHYFIEMTILPDSPFAASFLANFFWGCADDVILNNKELFIHAIMINGQEIQLQLVSNFLDDFRLKPEWEPINLALLAKFGLPNSQQQQKLANLIGPSTATSFWDLLEIPVVNHFRQWEMLYRLDKHIGESNRKRFFYELCRMAIREIRVWDEKTLVLVFDRFVLADNQDDDDLVFFYDLDTFHFLQDGNHDEVFLNKPSIPYLTARQVVLGGDKSSIVSLQLDAVNLLYARDLIIEQLAEKTNQVGLLK